MKAMRSPSLLVLAGVLSGSGWHNNSIEPIGNNMGTHHQMGRTTQEERMTLKDNFRGKKHLFMRLCLGTLLFLQVYVANVVTH